MKLSKQEKAARWAAFRDMDRAEKLEYVFAYYKAPILLCLLVLIILGSALHRGLTKKEPILYLAFANVSIGDDLKEDLTTGFLEASGYNVRKQTVYLTENLYLAEDADKLNHEYAYASNIKMMSSIQTKKQDVVWMNQEGYDLLSRKGYLLDLSEFLSENEIDELEQMKEYLTKNEVILSDNTLDFLLGETGEVVQVTESMTNALCISALPLIQAAGFDGELYLGVIVNSPRPESVLKFIQYCGEWKPSVS